MATANEELKKSIYALVARKKLEDDGFCYVYLPSDKTFVGRKGMVGHLKQEQSEKLTELRGEQDEAEFYSAVSKLVMSAPFQEEKKASPTPASKATPATAPAKVNGVEKAPVKVKRKPIEAPKPDDEDAKKDYPLTLDILKMIDARTTQLPNYGSLAGRIARLLAVVITKEGEGAELKLTFKKCPNSLSVSQYSEIYPLLEEKHADFIEHLCTMFPPAKKRLHQFIEKAAQNFDLVVPTLKQVEQAKKAEEEKKRAEIREALKIKREAEEKKKAELREIAKAKREEMNKKREEERVAVKRKLEEQKEKSKKLKEELEAKKKKEADGPVSAEETARRKKEIEKIKSTLTEGMTGVRRERLEKKLKELETKVNKSEKGAQEEQIKKRSESILEILTPKQLRKLVMIYFENLDNLEKISWNETGAAIKMEDDLEFLMDFFSLLFDMSRFHDQKSFKIGHILVTSKQAELIIEKGIWSYRDFIKGDAWRIPSSWDVDIPAEDLGDDWNRKDDSRLLIGASRFGKNLAKIMNLYPNMKAKSLDDKGKVKECVKSRFAYMLNVYQNRGRYVEELGLNLYSADQEEDENLVQETKPDIEVMEVEENGKEESKDKKEGEKETEDILESKENEEEVMEEDEVDEDVLLAED